MFIKLDIGLRINYQEYGNEINKHILFIHGLGSSSLIWRDIPQALSTYYHTIIVDLVGFGFSDKPRVDYNVEYFCNFIKKFLDKIEITEKDKKRFP